MYNLYIFVSIIWFAFHSGMALKRDEDAFSPENLDLPKDVVDDLMGMLDEADEMRSQLQTNRPFLASYLTLYLVPNILGTRNFLL